MKNRFILFLSTIIIIFVFSACSSETASGSFQKLDGTDPVKFTAITPVEGNRAANSSESQIRLSSELSKEDTAKTQKADADLNVYRKADEKSAKLGTIKKGSSFTVYAEMTDNWLKISYNGRVAYVKLSEAETTTAETETTTAVAEAGDAYTDYDDYDDDDSWSYTDDNADTSADNTSEITTESAATETTAESAATETTAETSAETSESETETSVTEQTTEATTESSGDTDNSSDSNNSEYDDKG